MFIDIILYLFEAFLTHHTFSETDRLFRFSPSWTTAKNIKKGYRIWETLVDCKEFMHKFRL